MAQGKRRSFRDKIAHNSAQQRTKASSYGHLLLPRGVNVFKEEPNTRVSLDFIPYVVSDSNHPDKDEQSEIAVKGSLWYRRPYKLHRNVGPENTSLVCPTSMGKKCPICEYRAKLLAEGTKWDDESVKSIKPSDRSIYYVRPKGVKKYEDDYHVWDISNFLFQSKLNDELEENDEFCDFPDLEDGLTLRIRFSEESFGSNKYADTSRIDFEQRNYKYDEKEIEELTPLDEVLAVKSYKEIEDIFLGSSSSDDEDEDSSGQSGVDEEDVDSRPLRRSRAGTGTTPKTVLRIKPDWEEQDDEDEEETEQEQVEEEEREPPSAYRRSDRNREDRSSSAGGNSKDTVRARDNKASPVVEKPSAAKPTRGKAADPEDKCPSGYRFGVDTDEKPECSECPIWNDCMDTKEGVAA